jgi:hypothetical protein
MKGWCYGRTLFPSARITGALYAPLLCGNGDASVVIVIRGHESEKRERLMRRQCCVDCRLDPRLSSGRTCLEQIDPQPFEGEWGSVWPRACVNTYSETVWLIAPCLLVTEIHGAICICLSQASTYLVPGVHRHLKKLRLGRFFFSAGRTNFPIW